MFTLFGVFVYNKWIRLKVFVLVGLQEIKNELGEKLQEIREKSIHIHLSNSYLISMMSYVGLEDRSSLVNFSDQF